ncbi:MAG: dihydropteridine reductase [Christensenellales bacterium]
MENQKQIEAIRNQYVKKEISELDKLKALDKKAKRPATIVAYVIGVIATLLLGVGMCLAMKVIGDLMPLGIVIGVIGIVFIGVNHLIYNKVLESGKKKYAEQIIEKSNELLNK